MLFRVHKNTVRDWLKSGLQPIDDRRPILILGRQLASFLHARRERRRQRCAPASSIASAAGRQGARPPGTAEYLPITASSGNLRALCADCGTRMYRRVSFQKLAVVAGDLQVQLPQAQQRIVEGADPCLNCDLERVPDAQPGK